MRSRVLFGPTISQPRRLPFKLQLGAFAAAVFFAQHVLGPVFGKELIGALAAQNVRRAHAADAAVMAMRGGTGGVIGWQIIERGGDTGLIEVIPERHPLAAQHCCRWLVVEGPEIELDVMVADVDAAFARQRLGGGEKGSHCWWGWR